MPEQTTIRNLANSEHTPRADGIPKSVLANFFATAGRVFSSQKFAPALVIAGLFVGACSTVHESMMLFAAGAAAVVAGLWLETRAIHRGSRFRK